MKKLFLILGGIVVVGLIIAAMYIALTIGLSCFIAYSNNARWRAVQQHEAQKQAEQTQKSIASWGQNSDIGAMEKQRQADANDATKPTLYVGPDGYDTEDNWLATGIAREIVEMAAFAALPDAPVSDLKIKAVVDPAKPAVHVEIAGLGGSSPLVSDLTPAFAWDPAGYAPLAAQVLGSTSASAPAPNQPDVLANLLNLTGKNLALEDVRLSADLQQHPASWADHDAAALVLTALALREDASS